MCLRLYSILKRVVMLTVCLSLIVLLSGCGKDGDKTQDPDPHLAELMRIGKSMNSLGHCETALHYYQRALRLSNSENNQKDAAIAKLEIGIVYFNLLRYAEAEKFLAQSLDYFQTNGMEDLEIRARGNLALVQGAQGNLESSIRTFQDILHIYSQRGDSLGVAKSMVNLANAYSISGQHLLAESYFHRVPQSIDLNTHPDQRYIYRFIRGRLYYDRHDYTKAKEILEELIAENEHIDYGSLMSSYDILLKIAVDEQDKDREIALLKERYETREHYNSLEIVWEALQKDLEVRQMQQKHSWILERNFFVVAIVLLSIALLFVLLHRKLSMRIKHLRGKSARLNDEVQTQKSEIRSIVVYHREMKGVLDRISNEVKRMQMMSKGKQDGMTDSLKRIRETIQLYGQTQKPGDSQEAYIDEKYSSFQRKLSALYPDLTNTEKHICALLLIDFSTKEISAHLNISDKSINNARSRIRKKLNIPTEISIGDFLRGICPS